VSRRPSHQAGLPAEALLAGYPEAIADLADQVRSIVRAAVPTAIEAVRPGWRLIGYNVPIGRRAPYFAWIMVQLEHVHLGFPQGVLLGDPRAELEGVGITKRARWLTAQPGGDLAEERYLRFAREAARVAGLSASEKEAIDNDRAGRRGLGDTQDSPAEPR
jgi:hypothetical protein